MCLFVEGTLFGAVLLVLGHKRDSTLCLRVPKKSHAQMEIRRRSLPFSSHLWDFWFHETVPAAGSYLFKDTFLDGFSTE